MILSVSGLYSISGWHDRQVLMGRLGTSIPSYVCGGGNYPDDLSRLQDCLTTRQATQIYGTTPCIDDYEVQAC